MEKEVPENILAKIRKLLRLKESAIKIGSEGEAHAAAEAVNRLLTSYNLSLMDVTPEEQKLLCLPTLTAVNPPRE